jgi:hypothetical protein
MSLQSKYYTNCGCLLNSTIALANPTADFPVSPTFYSGLISSTKNFLLGADTESFQSGGTVKRGFCEGGCDGFWTYVAISASFKFVGMLPFSGNQMLSFRYPRVCQFSSMIQKVQGVDTATINRVFFQNCRARFEVFVEGCPNPGRVSFW